MEQTQSDAQIVRAEFSCPQCGGVFSPPARRSVLEGLKCPYCGKEQPLDKLPGLEGISVAAPGSVAGPLAFALGKEAEPWRFSRDGLFGSLFAIAQAIIILGMIVSKLFDDPATRDTSVNICILLGTLAYLGAFGAKLFPQGWLQRHLVRRPYLHVDHDFLHLRTRSGHMRLDISRIEMVTALPICHLDALTESMLFGGDDKTFSLAWEGPGPNTLVLHLNSGLDLALPLLLTVEASTTMAGQLNRYLLDHPTDPGNDDSVETSLPDDIAAPRPNSRLRPGCLTTELTLPADVPPEKVFCPHCGAKIDVPPQIQFGDEVTCSYCAGLVVLRQLDESVLLKRVRLTPTARLLRQGKQLDLRQRRLAFKSLPAASDRGTFAIWAIGAVMLGSFPVLVTLRFPAYVWVPVLLTQLFPLFYLSQSTAVRGERSGPLLKVAWVLAAIGSSGLLFLPILFYRFVGRFNTYRLRLDGTRLQEGFRFGRARQISLDQVRRVMVFQWDRLEVVDESDTYVERVCAIEAARRKDDWISGIYDDEKNLEARAIWGLAFELKDQNVYLSKMLSDRSTAEIVALHINLLRG